jgi:hypothetical protein
MSVSALSQRKGLLNRAKAVIDTTCLATYWQLYDVSVSLIDEIVDKEIRPRLQYLTTKDQVLTLGQELSGISPYLIFHQFQIDQLYAIFREYLATF